MRSDPRPQRWQCGTPMLEEQADGIVDFVTCECRGGFDRCLLLDREAWTALERSTYASPSARGMAGEEDATRVAACLRIIVSKASDDFRSGQAVIRPGRRQSDVNSLRCTRAPRTLHSWPYLMRDSGRSKRHLARACDGMDERLLRFSRSSAFTSSAGYTGSEASECSRAQAGSQNSREPKRPDLTDLNAGWHAYVAGGDTSRRLRGPAFTSRTLAKASIVSTRSRSS